MYEIIGGLFLLWTNWAAETLVKTFFPVLGFFVPLWTRTTTKLLIFLHALPQCLGVGREFGGELNCIRSGPVQRGRVNTFKSLGSCQGHPYPSGSAGPRDDAQLGMREYGEDLEGAVTFMTRSTAVIGVALWTEAF